jgi:hypothetical protein
MDNTHHIITAPSNVGSTLRLRGGVDRHLGSGAGGAGRTAPRRGSRRHQGRHLESELEYATGPILEEGIHFLGAGNGSATSRELPRIIAPGARLTLTPQGRWRASWRAPMPIKRSNRSFVLRPSGVTRPHLDHFRRWLVPIIRAVFRAPRGVCLLPQFAQDLKRSISVGLGEIADHR